MTIDDNAKDVQKLTLPQRKALMVLKTTWEVHGEKGLKGKWYGVIY